MTPDELSAWEGRLQRWESELAQRSELVEAPLRCAALPAAPVGAALTSLAANDAALRGLDPAQLGSVLGLDPQLVNDVVTAQRDVVQVDEIREVCEALHCTPYQLWSPDVARTILDAYSPEEWPRYIEPLDDFQATLPMDSFVARRVAQQAQELVQVPDPLVLEHDKVLASVTPYRHTHVLAVDLESGARSLIDIDAPSVHARAQPAHDYFFVFEQLAPPVHTEVEVTDGVSLPTVPPPGLDGPPELTGVATTLRTMIPGTTLVRFQQLDTGTEHWLGMDPASGAWTSWDHPADHYPGDLGDVLRTAGLPDSIDALTDSDHPPLFAFDRGAELEGREPLSLGMDL